MNSLSPLAFTECFEQVDIDLVVGTMDRAWQVLQQLEPDDCTEEGRVTLALCVLSEARKGENSHVKLVNKAIVKYRFQRAKVISERRRA